MRPDHILLVARWQVAELRRDKTVLRSLFLQPLMLALVLLPAAIAYSATNAAEREPTVAVSGDTAGADELLSHLAAEGFEIRPTDNAAALVAVARAEVGIELPHELDRRVASGEAVSLELFVLPSRGRSSAVAASVEGAVASHERQLARSLLAGTAAASTGLDPVSVRTRDVGLDTDRGARITFASAFPLLIAFQLFGLLGLAQGRLAGVKGSRSAEGLLVLPVGRADIVAGVALGAALVGLAATAVVVVPAIVLAALGVGAAGGGPVVAAGVAATLLVEALLVASVVATAGAFLGAKASATGTGLWFAGVVQLGVFLALGAAVIADPEPSVRLALVPVIGPYLTAKGLIAGTATPAIVAAALASTVAFVVVAAKAGGRALAGEAAVLRATR